jgi:hypothetical protein
MLDVHEETVIQFDRSENYKILGGVLGCQAKPDSLEQ